MIAVEAVSGGGYPLDMPRRRPPKDKPPTGLRTPPNRLSALVKERGITYKKLAEIISTHPVHLSKLAQGKTKMTQAWMVRLGHALNVPPEEIIAEPAAPGVRWLRVKGALSAGSWVENFEWPEYKQYLVPLRDTTHLPLGTLYAAEVQGESMNLRFRHGSVVILSRIGSDPAAIAPGKRYHVRRTRPDGLTEETLKTLVQDRDKRLWLKPESDNPEFQEWIPIDDGEGTTVELVGLVRFASSKED